MDKNCDRTSEFYREPIPAVSAARSSSLQKGNLVSYGHSMSRKINIQNKNIVNFFEEYSQQNNSINKKLENVVVEN